MTNISLAQMQGQLYHLNDMTNDARIAINAGEKDGLDQVYIKGDDGQNYVVQGDGLNLDALEGQANNRITLDLGDSTISGEVIYVDNETNTAVEGAMDALRSTGTIVGSYLGFNGLMALAGSTVISGGTVAVTTGAMTIAGLGTGAYLGANASEDYSKLQPYLGAEIKPSETKVPTPNLMTLGLGIGIVTATAGVVGKAVYNVFQ